MGSLQGQGWPGVGNPGTGGPMGTPGSESPVGSKPLESAPVDPSQSLPSGEATVENELISSTGWRWPSGWILRGQISQQPLAEHS